MLQRILLKCVIIVISEKRQKPNISYPVEKLLDFPPDFGLKQLTLKM